MQIPIVTYMLIKNHWYRNEQSRLNNMAWGVNFCEQALQRGI